MNTGHSILVVDDDADIGIMMKMMLEYKGYTVEVTDRGEKAEEILHENNIDMLIMDMLLSGINGIDICRRVKQNSLTSRLPVLMISAHPHAKQLCLDAGADDFVAKPFDMPDLLSKINRLIGMKET